MTVTCRGAVISLDSAVPAQGFTTSVKDAGPDEVEVRFTSSSTDVEVQSWCQGGRPTGSVQVDS